MSDAVTGMTVEVETVVPVDPEKVWAVVTDVVAVSRFSPECVETGWLDGATGPVPGARFHGRNQANGREWTVTGQVVEVDRPRVFSWLMLDEALDPARPASTWRYELSPTPEGGTRIRHGVVHGPGGTGFRRLVEKHPERAEEFVAFRRQQVAENIRATLAAMFPA